MKINQTSGEDLAIPGLHDSNNVLSGSEGLRLALLPRDLYSSDLRNDDTNYMKSQSVPSEFDGYNVPSRSLATFAVRPRRVKRLSEPYGRCSKVNPMLNEHWQRADNTSHVMLPRVARGSAYKVTWLNDAIAVTSIICISWH